MGFDKMDLAHPSYGGYIIGIDDCDGECIAGGAAAIKSFEKFKLMYGKQFLPTPKVIPAGVHAITFFNYWPPFIGKQTRRMRFEPGVEYGYLLGREVDKSGENETVWYKFYKYGKYKDNLLSTRVKDLPLKGFNQELGEEIPLLDLLDLLDLEIHGR